ncbi:MAG: OadG family protein [Prevotellaceae bacterium]|jgi:Na+-transporting methylmalonyl-CoA/oxaloacetate decarboxylase gamma subunit|nr:OadG family protein [Prevotellaceae bacterium]
MNVIWSNALTVLGLGLFIVFVVLILLVFLLNGFSWFFIKKETPQLQTIPATTPTTSGAITPAEQAAVAMALHLFYEDAHDEESYVITIQQEPYNPWNSKIYGLNNNM